MRGPAHWQGVPTKTHVLSLLHRLIDGKVTGGPPLDIPQALILWREPKANVQCYDALRSLIAAGGAMRHDPAAGAIVIMLRGLKMYGIAQAVEELMKQGSPAFEAAIPILSQLLKADLAERDLRSIADHMKPCLYPRMTQIHNQWWVTSRWKPRVSSQCKSTCWAFLRPHIGG